MSDSIIIQAVYIAIGPFFIVEVGADGDSKGKKDNVIMSALGKSAMRGLRLDALSLIRNVWSLYMSTFESLSLIVILDLCEPRGSTLLDH